MRAFLTAVAFACCAAAAAQPASFQAGAAAPAASAAPAIAPSAAHPALYSFVDVYRLTVAGAIVGQPLAETAPDAPVRVAAAQSTQAEAQVQAEPRFLVSPVPPPDKWLLILAGLALAGWVAHRRLAHSL
jgi:hypothetical protein